VHENDNEDMVRKRLVNEFVKARRYRGWLLGQVNGPLLSKNGEQSIDLDAPLTDREAMALLQDWDRAVNDFSMRMSRERDSRVEKQDSTSQSQKPTSKAAQAKKAHKMLTTTESEWESVVLEAIKRKYSLESRRVLRHSVPESGVEVKNPTTLKTSYNVDNMLSMDSNLVERVNKALTRPYSAIPYLSKEMREKYERRIREFREAQSDLPEDKKAPLPEELAPYASLMEAKGENRKRLEQEQYINKLVPPNAPLHLVKADETPLTALRRQWKKKQRKTLLGMIKEREHRIASSWKRQRKVGKKSRLPIVWRGLLEVHLKRMRDELTPEGDQKRAFASYDFIRSNFAGLLDLQKNHEHLSLYLTGLAMYWDWDQARALFMKKFCTLWNPHGEIRMANLGPVYIMMRGLVHRKRSFEELLAMHSLVADQAANGLLKKPHGSRPHKSYYDHVLKILVEEQNWELAKKWFLHFYQTSLYNRQPASTAHVIPDEASYTLMLRAARLLPKVASVESHLILNAARHDCLKVFSTFDPSVELIEEVMQAHISDGDGEGAAITFTNAFQTPFSNGIKSFTKLKRSTQERVLLLYFEGLALKRDMNGIYRSLTALYHYDSANWMQNTAFHNEIMKRIGKYSYSHAVHFFKNIFRVKGRMHHNPVHPDFYTFETIMQKAVVQRRFMFARGLFNLLPPTIEGQVRDKLRNMTGLALKPAIQMTYKRDEVDQL